MKPVKETTDINFFIQEDTACILIMQYPDGKMAGVLAFSTVNAVSIIRGRCFFRRNGKNCHPDDLFLSGAGFHLR